MHTSDLTRRNETAGLDCKLSLIFGYREILTTIAED